MLKVGLTGGIACGKSTVAALLAARGAQVAKADEIAHQLMLPGQPVYEEIVRRFGRGILDAAGRIDRPRLAELAFAPTAPRIAELNAIVHPAVIAAQRRWMDEVGRRDPSALAVVEAALIFEAGIAADFDRIIVVVCEPQIRIERLAQRMGSSPAAAARELERRSAAQWPEAEKRQRADFVIYNNGLIEATAQQVEQLYPRLVAAARAY
jgi:dephospho-CoA kinase